MDTRLRGSGIRGWALAPWRVLAFDDKAGLLWARLMAEGEQPCRPKSALDMIVAATAGVHDCVVVTEYKRDSAGLRFVNPMRRG